MDAWVDIVGKLTLTVAATGRYCWGNICNNHQRLMPRFIDKLADILLPVFFGSEANLPVTYLNFSCKNSPFTAQAES